MAKRLLAVLLAALAVPGSGFSQVSPPVAAEPQVDWAAAARQDVTAAHDIYVDNHPGMHDPLNKGFPERLKRAREAGLKRAATASDRGGYVEALGAFSAELNDGHALIFAKNLPTSAAPRREWPGFVAAWRGDGALVHHSDPSSPAPVGSAILSCDGLTPAKLIEKRLAYRGLRAGEPGHFWMRGPQAFYSTPTFNAHRPERCTFRHPDGSIREAPLSYAPAPDNFETLLAAASDGERTPIGVSEPRPGILLLGMPDFQPDAEGVKGYRTMFDTLRANRADALKKRAVVIDLRHNNGGSSSWSEQAAKVLWGEQAVEQRMADFFKDVSIWWRASKDNVAFMSEMEAAIRRDGNNAVGDEMRSVGQGMKAALERGEMFYVQALNEPGASSPAKPAATDFQAPVYVITPGRCASACLDALDVFKRFPNVKLIGAPTSGDSTYMEVRTTDLPSGHGRIVIPNKIWMKRPRGSGEIYRPDIEMRDADWSTAAFLDRIERELAGRR